MNKKVLFIIIVSILVISNSTYALKLSEEAESYRNKGYEAQKSGNIDLAITWYQKSISLDPTYAAPHNDLGVLYETKGWLERAESEYKRALNLNPEYKSAHTNLAILYERRGDVEKAAFHWMKRYKLGLEDPDKWTEEAKKRLDKLGLLKEEEETIEIKEKEDVSSPVEKKESLTIKPVEKKIDSKIEKTYKNPNNNITFGNKTKKKRTKKLTKPLPKKVHKKSDEFTTIDERIKNIEAGLDIILKRERDYKKILEMEKRVYKDVPEMDIISNRLSKLENRLNKSPSQEELNKKLKSVEEKIEKSLKIKNFDERLEGIEKRLGYSKPKTVEKPAFKRKVNKGDKKEFSIELEDSLKIAEEKLKTKSNKSKPKTKTKTWDDSALSTNITEKKYYAKAKKYLDNGEYARALREIRVAKHKNIASDKILTLEQQLKTKMKQERINDHYEEGIINYRKENYSGAREEFEAILDVLPE